MFTSTLIICLLDVQSSHARNEEIPPRLEYVLTPFGAKFVLIMDDLRKHHGEIERELPRPRRHA